MLINLLIKNHANIEYIFERINKKIVERSKMAQDNANNIFNQYEDFTSRIEKLRNEAKTMLTPTLDKIQKEINDYNKLAEVAGALTRLSLTKNNVSTASTNASNDTTSESNTVSTASNATLVNTDDTDNTTASTGNDVSSANNHASSDDSNVNDTTAKKSSSSPGRFYEDDARVEEVERVDGSKVKVERYRKPVARKTAIPAPIDVENIDFTGSNDDTNVIVSSNDVANDSNSKPSTPDDSDDNELDFDDLLDDAITDNDDKKESSKKPSSTTTKKSTASHKSSSKTAKNHTTDTVESATEESSLDDSDDEPDPFAFIS